MNNILNSVLNSLKHRVDQDRLEDNIGISERALSVFSGGLVFGMGVRNLFKHPIKGCAGIAVGGALVYRGITGHSAIKKILDRVTDEEEITVIEHRYFVK